MVPITSLIVPIILSAVIVFIASSVIHMMLPIHKNDFMALPDEDGVMAALRKFNLAGGDYMMPKPKDMADMKSQAFQDKLKAGPWGIMTIMPGGQNFMGQALVMWFIFSVVISIFAGYVAGRALGPGANYLSVFRFAGVTAFLGYSGALVPQSIWWRKSWGTTIRGVIDGLIYGLLTAGTFGWRWPHS